MPATSEAQRRFFGAEYGRAKAGLKTKTGLSREKLREWLGPVKAQAEALKSKQGER